MSLTDDFMPALALAAVVAKDPELAATPHDGLREDVETLLRQALDAARQRDPSDIQDALFAACAFIDEVLLASSWSGRGQWLRQTLQQVHFNTTNAGDEFYQRLTELRARLPGQEFDGLDELVDTRDPQILAAASEGENPALRDTLELYLTCLALGFKGRYFRGDDQSVIRAHVRELLFRLGKPEGEAPDILFPELQQASGHVRKPGGWFNARAVFLFFLLTAVAGVLLYAGLFANMTLFVGALS
ncbi:type IV/VI secretion system protein, DotU family [Thiorhodovibrio winogradskyi]|uniref:Type IV/VI secretion system protein, DotU family n=1 Tax=Thiorhodovibrio winogradskyi TaxID=77007 RepID=A0ABZ0S6L4_9GAMM|nr:DotU family type IV/VI secretion system protein [Thiorhodovibrio winogradskyi]